MRALRPILVVPWVIAGLFAGASFAAEPTPLDALGFLLGAWEAVPGGQPGDPTGGCKFASALQGRVIVRTNHADYPAMTERPAFRHDDLMVIYAEGTKIKANYYDNEGHVFRYKVETPAEGKAVFVRDETTLAPTRISYALAQDGSVAGLFEAARPDKPELFMKFSSWTMKKTEKEK